MLLLLSWAGSCLTDPVGTASLSPSVVLHKTNTCPTPLGGTKRCNHNEWKIKKTRTLTPGGNAKGAKVYTEVRWAGVRNKLTGIRCLAWSHFNSFFNLYPKPAARCPQRAVCPRWGCCGSASWNLPIGKFRSSTVCVCCRFVFPASLDTHILRVFTSFYRALLDPSGRRKQRCSRCFYYSVCFCNTLNTQFEGGELYTLTSV